MTKNRADCWARGIYWECGGSASGPVGKRAVESGPGLLLYSSTSTHALGQRRWIGGNEVQYKVPCYSCLGLGLGLGLVLVLLALCSMHREVKTRSGCPWRRYRLPPFHLSAVQRSGGGKSGDDSVVPQRNSSTDHRELHIFLPVTY